MTSKAFAETERELDRAIDELRGMAVIELDKSKSGSSGAIVKRPVTLQIPVEVNIIFGSAEMSVAELSALETGATIQLDKRVGEPIDVVVNGVKIARGEITLQDGKENTFGIRITEII